MKFGDFARNYLNPFYLLARLCWLWGAFLVAAVGPAMVGLNWRLPFYALALVFVWVGLRPWGKGVSIHEINRRLDELNRR